MPEQAKKEAKEYSEKQEKNMEKKQEPKKECKESGEALKKKDEEIAELISTLQHLQADFENYRKRIERQNEEYRKFAKKDLIIKLLSVLDSFELALKHKPEYTAKCGDHAGKDHAKGHTPKEDSAEHGQYDPFIKGIEMIYASLYSLLEHEGVEKIRSGGMFDPELHEALAAEESDKKENTVLCEFQSGYRLHGHALRHAKVKIAKKKEEIKNREETDEK